MTRFNMQHAFRCKSKVNFVHIILPQYISCLDPFSSFSFPLSNSHLDDYSLFSNPSHFFFVLSLAAEFLIYISVKLKAFHLYSHRWLQRLQNKTCFFSNIMTKLEYIYSVYAGCKPLNSVFIR